jgi:hypothetical protein
MELDVNFPQDVKLALLWALRAHVQTICPHTLSPTYAGSNQYRKEHDIYRQIYTE